MSTIPDSVLRQVTIVGPEIATAPENTSPLWIAELATPHSGKGKRPVVAKRPGLSTLFERVASDDVRRQVSRKIFQPKWVSVKMRQPVLMRAQVGPTNERCVLKLRSGGQYYEGIVRTLGEKGDRVVVLAPRTKRWADQPIFWKEDRIPHAWVPEIGVPPLRLVEGRLALGLVANGSSLPKLLQLTRTSNDDGLILGGLKVELDTTGGAAALPIELVPQGIEFEAWLPDPTSDFLDSPLDDGTLKVFVRLENDGAGGLLLRLVGSREQEVLDHLERRLASELGYISAGDSPLAVRFDVRPVVPSIWWQLKPPSKKKPSFEFDGDLSLSEGWPRWNRWAAWLDPAGLDLRVVTGSRDAGIAKDVAQVSVRQVSLSRVPSGENGGATVSLHINSKPDGDLEKFGPSATLEFEFDDNSKKWGRPNSTFNDRKPAAVSIDLDVPVQRLDTLNRRAGVIDPAAQTPALFLLMRHGWLRAAVPNDPMPVPEASAKLPSGQVAPESYGRLTGRLVADQTAGRSIAIESAEHAAIVVEWKVNLDALKKHSTKVSKAQVSTWGTQGRLAGYLFCSEAIPTEEEVLPTLRGGSATLSDLRIDFGAQRSRGRWWSGSMTIAQTDAKDGWRLELDLPPASEPTLRGAWIAWLRDAQIPLISNTSLTRVARSAGQPSVSRDLLPIELQTGSKPRKLVLQTEGASSLPLVGYEGETRWLGQLFGKEDQTLLMPTLLGVEFQPSVGPPLPRLQKDDPPQPMTMGLTARLRLDLPQLDELMASVEIPRKPPVASPLSSVKTTALLPDLLVAAWQRTRDRMALTETQDNKATEGWFATGDDDPEKLPEAAILNLVQPFSWRARFGVSTSLSYATPAGLFKSQPLGSYWLGKTGYSLEQAALGIGTAREPAHFDISTDLKIVAGDVLSPLHVTGLAAALYKGKEDGADFDSRGFGMVPKAEIGNGLSLRRIRTKVGKAPTQQVLVTLLQTLAIEGKESIHPTIGLFIRDLPMLAVGDRLIFDGKNNPSESFAGTDGLAFDAEHLPFSLHEWRLFELGDDGAATRLYALRWGPLAFTPLRLWKLELDPSSGVKLVSLEVIGKLSLADGAAAWDPNSDEGDAPYGPDELYRLGDLFKLTVHENGTFALTGVVPSIGNPDSTPERLDFDEHQDSMVEIMTSAALAGHDDVPISLKLAPKQGGVAELRARLFGFERALKGKVTTFSKDGIEVQLAPNSSDSTCLSVTRIITTVSNANGRWRAGLEIDVTITLRNENNAVLFERSEDGTWRWLNLPPSQGQALKIDHKTGRVEWLVECVFPHEAGKAQLEPIAGLTSTGFAVRGVLAMAAPPQEPDAWPSFESGSTALYFEMEGREAPIPHAPEYLTNLWIRHSYGGVREIAPKKHALHVDWMCTCENIVRWPLGSVTVTDATGGDNRDWVRVMNIARNSQPLVHKITLRLREHEIPAGVLGVLPGPQPCIGVIKPWRFLATTMHRIDDANSPLEWTSLDHVAIMPARELVASDSDSYVFAARYRVSAYRTIEKASKSDVVHAGVAKRALAEAGFTDKHLQDHLQKVFNDKEADDLWSPVVVGGAAALFWGDDSKDHANLAVVPWLGELGFAKGLLPRLDQCDADSDLQWRISLADSRASDPVVMQRAPASVMLHRRRTCASSRAWVVMQRAPGSVMLPLTASSERIEGDLRKSLDGATETLSHIPVEQAYFELFDGRSGEAKGMDGQAASTIPYFPLALAVLQAVRKRGGAVHAISLFASTGLQSRAVRVQVQPEEAELPVDGSSIVPIDLYVVMRDGVRVMPQAAATALIVELDHDALANRAQLARLRDLATRGGSAPVAIIARTQRNADPAQGHLYSSIDPIPSVDDFGAAVGPGKANPSVPPSPALGWPSSNQTDNLGKLAVAVGSESPLLSEAAGFAGRGLALGLPAWAPQVGTGSEAMYLSFADHVVFKRPQSLGFHGPAARHLVPVPTRLRTPVPELQKAALVALTSTTRAEMQCAPILPPRLERTTIGDRPGAFHVMTMSVVVPAEEEAFDPDQPAFGRPASSGPVIVHQLRAPRSPALPDDQELGYRRRTFVSEADRLPKDAGGGYVSLCAVDQPAEVFREERYGGWRFTLVHIGGDKSEAFISPQWNGVLTIRLESRTAKKKIIWTEAQALMGVGLLPKSDPATLCASLRVGAIEFEFTQFEFSDPVRIGAVTTRTVTFSMQPAELAGTLLLLADSTADTTLALELRATPTDLSEGDVEGKLKGQLSKWISGALTSGPPRHLTVPLLRDPGTRPAPKVDTTTVVFGDPAYDRQLGSKTLASAPDYHDGREFVLMLDRDKYDLGSTIHLAGGYVNSASRVWEDIGVSLTLNIEWIPRPDSGPDAEEDGRPVYAAQTGSDAHMIDGGRAYAILLSSLRDVNNNAARLEAGDRLKFTLSALNTKPREVVVQLMEEPTIAPPPSVYALLAMSADGESASIPLHASAPLPSRIEFPDLLNDLAKGYIRRRALFVWSWAQAERKGMRLALLKLDRAGGSQLPRSEHDFIQV